LFGEERHGAALRHAQPRPRCAELRLHQPFTVCDRGVEPRLKIGIEHRWVSLRLGANTRIELGATVARQLFFRGVSALPLGLQAQALRSVIADSPTACHTIFVSIAEEVRNRMLPAMSNVVETAGVA
jgi:hypothetical protein